MATTSMVGVKSCKTFHTTTWKEVDVRFSSKTDAESQKQNPHVSKMDGRTSRNLQELSNNTNNVKS
jgi:hypothetical protein